LTPFLPTAPRNVRAFTLLELMTILVVVGILVVLLFPAIANVRARAQRIQCTSNLRNLYVAAENYLQQNGSWPQIAEDDSEEGTQAFAQAWVAALTPFSVTQKTWICPTIQDLLHSPDYTQAANARVDYIATPFDSKPTTPHQWPQQPWFVEAADVPGHGNLIIFTDGSIKDLKTVLANPGK
jgi:type II secretory pathway pseudopilin PulG